MKKISAISLPFFSYLSLSLPAFAASQPIPIDPCTDPGGQNFNLLCDIGATGIGGLINAVITIAFIIATIVALAYLIFGGIKWITSGGDKAGVEGARNMIVAALVGLVIVFLSYLILNFILNIFGLGSLGQLTIPSISL